ncbi:lysosomal proton-coupled steroid conjugate and bile acid symporter SLC46A3 isoform X2 [Drosophila bipectinata]|uniref:lysosomal proton-coupled steroid conjugate and bile acid symporter SLC46A3 isoform X2 n=1 Tax=Drosophila bipectinata TaxID=42026 RepID=UPI0038B325E8
MAPTGNGSENGVEGTAIATPQQRRHSQASENSTSPNLGEVTARRSFCQWTWHVVTSISVEPTMFLYMFAFMITSVVEQNFFLYKSCRVNNNFTEEICRNINLPENKVFKDASLKTNAWFLQWENISAHVFPIILALFLGSFSDRRGRKLPLLIGLFGKFIYSTMIVVNAKMPTWPVQNIIYSATLPSALTGADVAIFASCFAYISDISTLEQRTIRVTILDVIYLSAMPTGVALGSHLYYKVFNQSYADMFTVNASLLALAIIYSFFALKWQTTPRQRSLRELGYCGFWVDYFDKQHVKDSFAVLVKKRRGHRRSFLIILLVSMALYTFQRDEGSYLYMYTLDKFNWDVSSYSSFKTFKSSAYVIAMLLAVPLMNKVLGWRDTIIIFIGTWAHTIARLFFYFADNTDLLYAGAVVCSLGPIVGPMIRAMTSKIVPTSERGKVFALLAVCDNAVPFISGVCYSQLYRATKSNNNGGAVFMLTIATQLTVFVLILCIHIILGKNSLAVPEVPEKESGLIPKKQAAPDVPTEED